MSKEETADVQIRVSKKTLEAIEKHGTYEDKNPEGVLKRILPQFDELKASCSATKPEEKIKEEEKEAPIETTSKESIESEKKPKTEEPADEPTEKAE